MESGENPEQSGYCNVEQLHYATVKTGRRRKLWSKVRIHV